MNDKDKPGLLKSVKLLAGLPDEKLAQLGRFLLVEAHEDGQTLFAEGSKGESLYFITSGHVRIAKKLKDRGDGPPAYKELAILGPGDCFGEMALIEAAARSADAIAQGPVSLLRLDRTDLNRWLTSDPRLAMTFFAQLVHVLSARLRTSSGELTLLYDLSSLLMEPFAGSKDLLDKAMTRVMSYLESGWSAGAYVYNEFTAELDLVDTEGDYEKVKDSLKLPANPAASGWLDDSTYQVLFPGEKRMMGHIVFRRAKPLDGEEKNEFVRTITATARLITSALINIGYRTEETLRARLKKNTRIGGL